MEPVLTTILALSLAAAAGAALAWLLRGAGIPGGRPAAAVVGGVLAGVLLGPAVFGRVAPDVHERLLRGGVAERAALDRALARHAADRVAITAAGPDQATVAAMLTRQSVERAPLEEGYRRAVAAHRTRFMGGVVLVLAIGLLASAGAARPVRAGEGVAGAAGILAVCAVVAEVAFIGGVAHLLGAGTGLALAAGAAGAGGSVLAGVPLRWVPRRGRSSMARATGAAMYVLAVGVVLAVSRGGDGAMLAAALIAAPLLGWSLRRAMGRPLLARRLARGVLLWGAIPMAAAAGALHVEWETLGGDRRAELAVPVLLLLSGNGAIVGLFIGSRVARGQTGGRLTLETVVDWHSAGYGVTQVCLVAAMLAANAADPLVPIGSGVLAGLLLSAALGEVTLPWLRGMVSQDAGGGGGQTG